MYVIQVNTNYWLVGIWRGWLMLSSSASQALPYQTQAAVEEAADFYQQKDPSNQYKIQTVFTVDGSE